MPTHSITLNPDPIIFPWSGLPDQVRDQSRVPRGDVRFLINRELLSKPAAGEDIDLQVFMTLPSNFAFAVAEVNAQIDATTGNDSNLWDASGQFNFNDGTPPGQIIYRQIAGYVGVSRTVDANAGEYGKLTTTGGKRIYSIQDPPNAILVPQNQSSCISLFRVANPTIDDNRNYVFTLFARFLMYDIQQAYNYEPNTPQLVR